MIGKKISPLSRIGSAVFITCMAIFCLKLFDVYDLGVPKAVMVVGLAAGWIMREVGWAKERKTNA